MVESADGGGYIRGIIINNSFKLFGDYFPFGSGAATYGSVLSTGSQIYQELGLSSMLFFEEMSGIYDSNWASILGEFGLMGILLFSFLIRKTYNSVKVDFVSNKSAVCSILVIFIISGITMPVLMNGYLAMLFAIFLIYFKMKNLYQIEDEYLSDK